VTNGDAEIVYRPNSAPPEIQRRVVSRALSQLATEGPGGELRGRELERLIAMLASGGTATIRGVRCSGGSDWRFSKAPARKA
jgi:tRNA(Ile)-lysidine synthase